MSVLHGSVYQPRASSWTATHAPLGKRRDWTPSKAMSGRTSLPIFRAQPYSPEDLLARLSQWQAPVQEGEHLRK